LVAFRLAHLDQLEVVRQLGLKRPVAGYGGFDLVALAQNGLRLVGRIPELGILGDGIQFVETTQGVIPVKDASSAASAIP
jgi:hypothetical protein